MNSISHDGHYILAVMREYDTGEMVELVKRMIIYASDHNIKLSREAGPEVGDLRDGSIIIRYKIESM